MARGVKKSIEQHKIEGTFRSNEHSGKGFGGEIVHPAVNPPKRMHERAKQIWVKLLPVVQKGQVFQTDLLAFEILCNAWADYDYCVQRIVSDDYVLTHTNNDGATNLVRHPLSTDKKQAYDMLQQMLGRFGLTPVDRAKVYLALEDNSEDELDGLV